MSSNNGFLFPPLPYFPGYIECIETRKITVETLFTNSPLRSSKNYVSVALDVSSKLFGSFPDYNVPSVHFYREHSDVEPMSSVRDFESKDPPHFFATANVFS
ncbi:hypothetical protein TNCV_5107981 [Trichonephila clavipes]|nr:hypothetical protein TNCV_5107981 [Trichonephila clavipes]